MNYFDTDNREFAKHFVKYGVIPTDKELPYDASDESAMGEYVHPLKDIERFNRDKKSKQEQYGIKTENYMRNNKRTIRLSESDLHRVIKESVKRIINEVSADLADRAARKAYMKAREGFGKYGNGNEIPWNSPHGKKFLQGEKFLSYRNEKLGGNEGYWIYYPNGDGSTIALKDAEGNIVTKPCHSVAELEAEFNKLCGVSEY